MFIFIKKYKKFSLAFDTIISFFDIKKYLKSKPPLLIVGKKNCYFIGKFFYGDSKVHIGNYCAIGRNLRIIASNHNTNLPMLQGKFYREMFHEELMGIRKGTVTIGSDVWIGDNVIILGNTKIGDGACIGAGSVVTKDVPPYAIVAGVPARIIKSRFREEIVSLLMEIKWWNWSDDEIVKNKVFFDTNLNENDIESILKSIILN